MIIRDLFTQDTDSEEESEDDSEDTVSDKDVLEQLSEPLSSLTENYLTLQYQLLKKNVDLGRMVIAGKGINKSFQQIQTLRDNLTFLAEDIADETERYKDIFKPHSDVQYIYENFQDTLFSVSDVPTVITKKCRLSPARDLWGDMMDLVQQKKQITVGMAGLVKYLGMYTGGILTLNDMLKDTFTENLALQVYGYLNIQTIHSNLPVHVIVSADKGIPISATLTPMVFNYMTGCPLIAYPIIATIACAGAIIFFIEDTLSCEAPDCNTKGTYITCIPNSDGDKVLSEMTIDIVQNEVMFQPISKTEYIDTLIDLLHTIDVPPSIDKILYVDYEPSRPVTIESYTEQLDTIYSQMATP